VTPLALLLAGYAAVVIALGVVATRRGGDSPEDYFLAGRKLGTLVLFMALFGTNCSPFVLVGVPGLAYGAGIGVFGLNAPIVAFGVPLLFWAIGSPARRMAQRLGALTPAELYARRLESRAIGWLLFFFFTFWTLPYMVGGLRGAALTLEQAAGIDPRLGGLGIVALAVTYTLLGGMLATAWTNVLQGALFLGFMVLAFFLVPHAMGGFGAAMEQVRARDPELLRIAGQVPLFEPGAWASWSLVIALTVIAFPHMLARLMAARDENALRQVARLYPLALVALWTPAVLIGVWGAAAFPGLEQPDQVFYRVVDAYLPAWLAPVGFLAVLAALMSTLDAQILTLGSMLVRDVVDSANREPGPEAEQLRRGRDVRYGRVFVVVIGALVYVLAQTWQDSVFAISRKAFEGYTMGAPLLFLGVRWRRFTAAGAAASLLVGHAVLALGWAGVVGSPGTIPVLALAAALATAVLVSLLSRPASRARTALAFGD